MTGSRSAARSICIAAESTTDLDVPSLGDGYFYLVAGANTAGEGALERDSTGGMRDDATSCP